LAIDVDAFYRRYGPLVLRRCRNLLRDEAQAVDATQDVFVQLLVHHRRLDDGAPSSLLLRMATNVCLNRIRTRRRRPEEPSDDDLLVRIAGAENAPDRSEARSLLARLFGQVPESSRTIAVMHLLDGLTLEQVADEVGMSVSGVRKRLRMLRAQVHELEGI
jgi:RNA polymerase sigma-70 factor (ECF subfamily)